MLVTAPFHPLTTVDDCSASSNSSKDSTSVVESSGVASGPLGASETLAGAICTSDDSETLALFSVAWILSEVVVGFSGLLAFLSVLGGSLELSVVSMEGRRLFGDELVTVLTRTSLVPRRRCCRAPPVL